MCADSTKRRSKHTHTPKPWIWGLGHDPLLYSDQGCRPIVLSARDNTITLGQRSDNMGGVMRPARVFVNDGRMMHPDGLLIAAAPDLLEACESISRDADMPCVDDDGVLWYRVEAVGVERIRAAIAKALV
jgi:hypothetical protein